MLSIGIFTVCLICITSRLSLCIINGVGRGCGPGVGTNRRLNRIHPHHMLTHSDPLSKSDTWVVRKGPFPDDLPAVQQTLDAPCQRLQWDAIAAFDKGHPEFAAQRASSHKRPTSQTSGCWRPTFQIGAITILPFFQKFILTKIQQP